MSLQGRSGISSDTRSGPHFISADEIAGNLLSVAEVNRLVRDVLVQYEQGKALGGIKTEVRAPDGGYHQALPSLLPDRDIACLKWVSVPGATANLPINGTILLSGMTSGALVAILDATSITAMRTAAMSAIAADALAKRDSARLGVIGAGIQARSHIEALIHVRPTLKKLTVYSRTTASASALATFAEQHGLDATVATQASQAVAEHDIVVTTVPLSGLTKAELDARWLSPGSFVAMPDLGRGWSEASLDAIDLWSTDNVAQMAAITVQGKSPVKKMFDFELPKLAVGQGPSELGSDARRGFVFGGMGICDAALAVAYLERLRPGILL